MNRRKAREAAFTLLFEAKFHRDQEVEALYETAKTARGVEEDEYLRAVVAGVAERKEELDAIIEKHSHGWKRTRISPVSLSIMELAVYEIYYREDIPALVSVNEALELVKAYDEDGARAFVNGVLNAVVKERETENAN